MKLMGVKNINILQGVFSFVSKITEEATLHLNNDGIIIVEYHSSSGALIAVKIPQTYFSIFDPEDTKSLRVNVSEIATILRNCNKGDTIDFFMESSNLIINIQSSVVRKHQLPTFTDEHRSTNIPLFHYSIECVTDGELLNGVAKDLEGEEIEIEVGKNIQFRYIINLRKSQLTPESARLRIVNSTTETFSILFPKSFLVIFFEQTNNSKEVKLFLGENTPLCLEFESDDIKYKTILSPRIPR